MIRRALNFSDRRLALFWLLAVGSSLIALIGLSRLWGPPFISSFPFMWPDSYDWVANALYYLGRHVYGVNLGNPTVRSPVFPMVLGASVLAGHPELIVALIQLSFLGVVFGTYYIGARIGLDRDLRLLLGCVLVFHFLLNIFRIYLMADTICMLLTVCAALLYISAMGEESWRVRELILAALLSSFAGMTQLFGFFPLLLASLFLGIRFLVTLRPRFLLLTAVNFLGFVIPMGAWAVFKKLEFGSYQATTVQQFSLLKFDLQNIPFYWNVWGVVLFSFLPVLIALMVCPRPKLERPVISSGLLFIVGLAALFIGFTLFYHWRESRFLMFGFPFLGLAVLGLMQLLKAEKWSRPLLAGVLISTVYLASVPVRNFMQPSFSEYISDSLDPFNWKGGFLSKVFESGKGNAFGAIGRCIEYVDGQPRPQKTCDRYVYTSISVILRYCEAAARAGDRPRWCIQQTDDAI